MLVKSVEEYTEHDQQTAAYGVSSDAITDGQDLHKLDQDDFLLTVSCSSITEILPLKTAYGAYFVKQSTQPKQQAWPDHMDKTKDNSDLPITYMDKTVAKNTFKEPTCIFKQFQTRSRS